MTISPYVAALEIADERARLVLAPDHGAAVLRYDLISEGNLVPVFRPTPQHCQSMSDYAMFPMLPWVNRMSGGGFRSDGVFHPLDPNVTGQSFPIHGNGFQSRWSVARHTPAAVDLTLTSDGPGPYRYEASYGFCLEAGALVVTLTITNQAAIALPYGLGLHPWIVRHRDTALFAKADRYWDEDADHLPTATVDLADDPDVDFRTLQSLPAGWINASFEGWDGSATLRSPSAGLSLQIDASAPLGIYHLYSLSIDADFVCFEPVTHIVDGFNRRESTLHPLDDRLEPDASMTATCRFSPTLGPSAGV